MKTTFYILLILLLTCSLGNAQSITKVEVNNKLDVVENVSNDVKETKVQSQVNLSTEESNNEIQLIDAVQLKETVARGTSDIRLYFNRLRNVDNLNVLFPKINKAKKA
ncbi:hypothetical protein [Siansivirga zeaxanthinifaciens]|uniref:TonB-dependent receptor n=1 Tax=Siansivirga zeaxanthinifaciens CC-SAMT-1 TaxID=1454006 RepID=A0A0C5W0Y2_9FLAO|nr:hypothetical protein [Siansivirga zeaxanthinifaciens]AJR05001.1 hypothetical protein AW14_14195 [Siansivirga zeaxanthinifaciens CC-SAMT-1]